MTPRDITTLIQHLADACSNDDDSAAGTVLADLAGQAHDLSQPVLDYEAAARDAGWAPLHYNPAWKGERYWHAGDHVPKLLGAEAVCESEYAEKGISLLEQGYGRPIVAFYLVDPDFTPPDGRIDRDFAGLCVWASPSAR